MGLNKNQIKRIAIIDQLISSPLYYTKEEIREALMASFGEDISGSTIEKDIQCMKEDYFAPIKYSRLRMGYYYSEQYDFVKAFINEWRYYINFDKYLKL